MTEGTRAKIGIILGSSSDLRLVKSVRDVLEDFGEPYELIVASAHRTPRLVQQWTEGADDRGLRVIIAAAGAAAALPGTVAAHTTLPVIGLPLDTTVLRGVDSLYAIVQMPPGIPVATVGIGNGDNAALLALQILGLSDPEVRGKVEAYRRVIEERVFKANRELYNENPHLRPLRPGEQPPPRMHPVQIPEEEAASRIEAISDDNPEPAPNFRAAHDHASVNCSPSGRGPAFTRS
jgi:5-(carboxyamino)imidazole ribonucleotide mutase